MSGDIESVGDSEDETEVAGQSTTTNIVRQQTDIGDAASMRRWANSMEMPVRSEQFTSVERFVDSSERVVAAIERTLNAMRDASINDGNSLLVNRLTTAKDLPSFSGNTLEWLYFKEAFKLSSEL